MRNLSNPMKCRTGLFLRLKCVSLTLTGKWKQVVLSLELTQAGYVTERNCS